MILQRDGQTLFPLGTYEIPRDEAEWQLWRDAGVNLLRCNSREDLDRAHEHGMFGWLRLRLILDDDDDGAALAEGVNALKDHPALVVWECPDEAIWHAMRDEEGNARTRLWELSADDRAETDARFDALVRGMERGTALVRRLDPSRPIWLNEAAPSNRDVLGRCAGFVDIVGFDWYPIPNRVDEPMQAMGKLVDLFGACAPGCDLWIVQQGFSWSYIDPTRPEALPTPEEARFMAWQAIAHGATGLAWWGLRHVTRPSPFIARLMGVVAEFKELHPFLHAGQIVGVRTTTDTAQFPPIIGVSHLARRVGNRTMLVVINEDPYEHDVIVSGLDWLPIDSLRPVVEPRGDLVRVPSGYITRMQGYEVRIYLAG